MRVRFLLDENLSLDLLHAILLQDRSIDVLRIGDEGAPPRGTLDPDILLYCEREHRCLVTDNRKTMPKHVRELEAAGHHHWGVLEFRHSRLPVGLSRLAQVVDQGVRGRGETATPSRWQPARSREVRAWVPAQSTHGEQS